MNSNHARPSLLDLRDKTDRQLMLLAGKEIERALSLIRRGDLADAEAGCRQAGVLLTIARAADWERGEMEARLELARATIDRARSGPMTFTQAACG
jgi:hypothetical protein